jgi:ubiquinone/menaquinone biosynthesis C-methylase UbiE
MGDAGAGGWQWDPSLYEGAAAYYAQGRVPYPPALIDVLVAELGLGPHRRLLDIGCGPGSLTLPLAPHVEQAVGVDADQAMLAEARRSAAALGVRNATWVHRRAEDLPTDLGPFQAVTMAQSFHWMNRRVVVALVARLLANDGAIAYVHATTHQGRDGARPLAPPRRPHQAMEDLLVRYLGTARRAGRGYRHIGAVSEDEQRRQDADIFGSAGLTGPVRRVIPGWVVERSTDEVVASIFSLSYAAPHLFGERAQAFEHDLRALLERTSPDGRFSEEMREIAVDFWRR